MSTRRIALAGVLATSAIITSAGTAAAQSCWDFATLDQSHLYRIGEIFVAPTATIEMKHYLLNGNKVTDAGAVGHARQAQIAGGAAPEFRLYQINAHIVPDTPATTVSYLFGHHANGKSGVAHANLGVNGELVETTTGMSSLDGLVLGDPAIGTARVTVTMLTPAGANPEKGIVQLQMESGLIEKFTIGGIQKYIDDLCIQ
jgi:hypothetical protein